VDVVLVFAVVLFAAVVLSELASRSVLSTSVLFLAAGLLAGPAVLGIVDLRPGERAAQQVAEVALFAVLFTDGMRIGARELRRAWRLPGRALLLGMPLTFAGTTLLAHALAGLDWLPALLVGAVLAPTDPVLAAALVGRAEVPERLRRLLNVESGLNDGLALPAVFVLVALAGGGAASPPRLLLEVVLGLMLGVAIPCAALWIEARPPLRSHAVYQPLLGVSIALLIFSLSALLGANEFLAAFAGGVTVASWGERVREEFQRVGEVLVELLKLAALLVFGALISPSLFLEFGPRVYVWVVLVLVLVRPAAVLVALAGSRLGWRETLAAAWFGPKGFASVVYALWIVHSGIPDALHLYHLVALVIAVSIVAHSSTDVLVARWFREETG
jgi:NhaP-type Na+/H+ or K+/H+ antiporter